MIDIPFNIIENTNNGVILNVRLVPNSSFNKIVDYTSDYIRIKIASVPIENRANQELINFCSKIFDVNKSKISIVKGEKSKLKKILINENFDIISKKLLFVLKSIK